VPPEAVFTDAFEPATVSANISNFLGCRFHFRNLIDSSRPRIETDHPLGGPIDPSERESATPRCFQDLGHLELKKVSVKTKSIQFL